MTPYQIMARDKMRGRTGWHDRRAAGGRACGLRCARKGWTLELLLLLETLPSQAGGARLFVFCCANVVSSKLAELLADVKRRHYGAFDYASLQLRDFGVLTDRKQMIFMAARG